MAHRIDAHQTLDAEQDNPLDWIRRRNPTESEYRRDQDRFTTMTCDELGTEMNAAMHQASSLVNHRCGSLSCSFSIDESHEVETLATTAMRVAAISHIADQKLCLPEVMAAAEAHSFSSSMFRESFLASAVSGEARERFSRAFSKMAEVKSDIEALRGSVVDRRLLMPTNIENPAVCPTPCRSCTTQHNSWHKAEEAFSFKCILNPGDAAPVGQGMQCSEPVLRNSVMHRIHSRFSDDVERQFKTWCEVSDWEELASQTMMLSAQLTCGAKAIFAPIQTGDDMSADLHATCVAKESGEAIPQAALDELIELDNTVGHVVSPSNLAIFSLLMSVDITSAVGNLRQTTRTQTALGRHSRHAAGTWDGTVDFAGAAQGSIGAHDVRLAYNHTYTEGSTRQWTGACRRSIFSLTLGIFTGIIQIVIGVAYLAVMLTFGVLTGLVAGTTAIVDWATGPAAGANTVAAERLRSTADMVGTWGLTGVFVGFTVAFGVWGLSNIIHARRSPYDCSSGQLGTGPNAICHPALRYGETSSHTCPGSNPHDITFYCLHENRGVAIFTLPRFFGAVTRVETMTNGCSFFD